MTIVVAGTTDRGIHFCGDTAVTIGGHIPLFGIRKVRPICDGRIAVGVSGTDPEIVYDILEAVGGERNGPHPLDLLRKSLLGRAVALDDIHLLIGTIYRGEPILFVYDRNGFRRTGLDGIGCGISHRDVERKLVDFESPCGEEGMGEHLEETVAVAKERDERLRGLQVCEIDSDGFRETHYTGARESYRSVVTSLLMRI